MLQITYLRVVYNIVKVLMSTIASLDIGHKTFRSIVLYVSYFKTGVGINVENAKR